MINAKIGFIGAGNMAGALIEGLTRSGQCSGSDIAASDTRPERLAELHQRFGIIGSDSNRDVTAGAEVVVLATKPQSFAEVLPEIADASAGRLVISIAAGVPLASLEALLAADCRVVRAMPNTPALVGVGATALCRGRNAMNEDVAAALTIFSSVGIAVEVPESAVDAVTALSGSGPAYVFAFVEALAEAGRLVGLDDDMAQAFAIQTVYGSGKLLIETGESPATLRKMVSSPGGTTIAGLAVLNERNMAGTIHAAVEKAAARAREIGQTMDDELRHVRRET
jgi:pyrroline-5-carboxylate reductase